MTGVKRYPSIYLRARGDGRLEAQGLIDQHIAHEVARLQRGDGAVEVGAGVRDPDRPVVDVVVTGVDLVAELGEAPPLGERGVVKDEEIVVTSPQ